MLEGDEMGRAYSKHGGEKVCIHVLVGKPEGKKLLGRSINKWV
jgi:hypothetical protein